MTSRFIRVHLCSSVFICGFHPSDTLTSMRCLSCKYDLSNLTEHRCPECGRIFDVSDSRTFDAGPVEVSTWPRFYLTSAIVFIFAFGIILGLTIVFEPQATPFGAIMVSLFLASCFMVVVWLFELTNFVNLAVWRFARWRYNRN